MEQQDPPGKPLLSWNAWLLKWCPGELGVFQELAPKSQIGFSCSKNGPSSPWWRRAQVLIYYWACLKRHLGKSTQRQICNDNISPGREGSRVHVQRYGKSQHRQVCWHHPKHLLASPSNSSLGSAQTTNANNDRPSNGQHTQINKPLPILYTLCMGVGVGGWIL